MASYENTTIKKMNYNGQKVKKWYHDSVRVFTAGNVVTYYVNSSTSYQEEVDSEASCLSPTTFTPELSGYTFVGWREDTVASGEVLSEKIMGDEPISLYAVFKKTFTLSFANNYASGGATNPVSGNQYYNNGNIVIYEGALFKCIEKHISASTFDKTKWQLLAGFVKKVYQFTTVGATSTLTLPEAVWNALSLYALIVC